MESPSPTLLDLLTSQQFRIVTLLTLGLHVAQVADLLETSEEHVYGSLAECLKRATCRDTRALALRLRTEYEHDLYGEGLKEELAELQNAVKRMLEKVKFGSGASLELCDAPSAEWVM
jgi:hypothetical protein